MLKKNSTIQELPNGRRASENCSNDSRKISVFFYDLSHSYYFLILVMFTDFHFFCHCACSKIIITLDFNLYVSADIFLFYKCI